MEDFNWIWQLLGRLHPLFVHFPIGLLVVALFLELRTIGGKRQGLREGISWMIYLGAFFAVLSAIFGWLLSTYDDYNGDLVLNHRNVGIATVVLSLATTFLLRRTLNGKFARLSRLPLVACVDRCGLDHFRTSRS